MLKAESITKQYGEHKVLNNVSFQVDRGTCMAIIGPNGSGKSTLLKMISGLLPATAGEVKFENKNILHQKQKSIARKMAVLSQDGLPASPISVFDTVLMGRYPHLKWYQRERDHDIQMVNDVLESTGLSHLKDQLLDTLSGGEKQRVAIAKAMVQQPEILLLDEPTTFLDIGHQINVLELVKRWQHQTGLTVVMVLHDLNLAAQYSDQLILLNNGIIEKVGTSEEVIQKDILQKVYETVPEIVRHPKNQVPQILLTSS
ncbi:ABC transporter ATP-binding protein [Virgibacillus sp. MSP4-1]|uniref:ABC transporter ATP-binding protein n=1 Tax=Virgibacillus sp. MSP4-1 TaxID=2700081 RepID=UPI00039FAAA8|nr:ABC transporter ATP-binding protein [Virgibacillus sp. MSP4-1]QHS24080.1 ABC transporter ATP-binding protein [Virgibacillus sp. MSP4-1]